MPTYTVPNYFGSNAQHSMGITPAEFGPEVHVRLTETNQINVHPDRLKEALSEALGWEITEKEDLPEVTHAGFDTYTVEDNDYSAPSARHATWSAEHHEGKARVYRAIAAYIEANPPVDPKVEALAEVLGGLAVADEYTGERNDRQLARLLLATGRIDIKEEA